MKATSQSAMFLGLAGGVCMTIVSAALMGQGAYTPVKSDTQYFATGEGDEAHLWVREGTTLRCVGHGSCAAHKHGDGHDHKEGDGHDHDKPTGN